MANNFSNNFTREVAKVFLEKFESARVISKNVNTQLLEGRFNPSSGANVDFKRPTDYTTYRNATGDLTSHTADDIIVGKATGTVQNYFTVYVEYDEVDEALKMDQLDELLAPMATRIATDMEKDFASFVMKNSGLISGTVGTAVTEWNHVSRAGAVMRTNGVPMDQPWCYFVNPYAQDSLASNQRSLGAGGSAGDLISDAVANATIAERFAGFKVMTADALGTYTTGTGADRTGAVNGAPDATYATAMDTMTQSITVDGFQANLAIAAGERITVTGPKMLNKSTKEQILDASGAAIDFTAVVTTAVTLDGTGAGTITVAGPAIFESGGAYNTVSQAIADNDVITIGGSADTTYQPNIFMHPQAFAIGSVPLKKLYSTDTLATTEDGLQLRISKGSDFTKNQQKVRFDFLPAYAVLNPYFAGHGYGFA